MSSDIPAFPVTEATVITSTADVGQTGDLCLIVYGKWDHVWMLVNIMLIYGSNSYLIMTKCTVPRQFNDKGLVEKQTRDGLVAQVHSGLATIDVIDSCAGLKEVQTRLLI